MKPNAKTLPIEILTSAIPASNEFEPLLSDEFARQLSTTEAPSQVVLSNLLKRVQTSVESTADKVLTRSRRIGSSIVCEGVTSKTLYATQAVTLRPGEPIKVSVFEFAAGASLNIAQALASDALTRGSIDREWLVVKGDITLDGEALTERDYKIIPRDSIAAGCTSEHGALVFIRESSPAKRLAESPCSSLDSSDHWPEYAPGIRRRVLWQRDGIAAMLYLTEPQAQVPHHSHHHDEECFMVQGELYLDDVLLLEGDYQLAKGGSQHHVTRTDTGVVLFAHGDVDLRFFG
jgi:ChrR Cupin-like domain